MLSRLNRPTCKWGCWLCLQKHPCLQDYFISEMKCQFSLYPETYRFIFLRTEVLSLGDHLWADWTAGTEEMDSERQRAACESEVPESAPEPLLVAKSEAIAPEPSLVPESAASAILVGHHTALK